MLQNLLQPRRFVHAALVLVLAGSFVAVTADTSDARKRRLAKAAPVVVVIGPDGLPVRAVAKRRRGSKIAAPKSVPKPTVVAPAIVTAATLPPTPFAEEDSQPGDVVVGSLKARIHQETPVAKLVAGTQVAANIVIEGSGPVEMLVESEGGELVPLLGTGITTGPREIGNPAAGQLARFDLGVQGRSAITMEMKAGDAERARLRVTLSSLAGVPTTTSTILGWRKPSCADTYHTALWSIRDAKVPLMSNVVEVALAQDSAMTGNWRFGRPKLSTVVNAASEAKSAEPAGGKCIDQRVRQDYITGEKTKFCRRWKAVAPAAEAAAASGELSEAEIIALADGFVKSRLAIKAFERKRVLRLKSFDLLNSLRQYIEQPLHPALCTGANEMLDYYVENTWPLSDSIDRIDKAAASAAQMAIARADMLLGRTTAELDAEATQPMLISAAVAAPQTTVGSADLLARIKALATQLLTDQDAALIANETDAGAAFTKLAAIIKPAPNVAQAVAAKPKKPGKKAAPVNAVAEPLPAAVPASTLVLPVDPELATRREAATEVLAMLEAAMVLEAARSKFAQFHTAGYATADAIRAAHKQHCTCPQ